MQLLAEGLKGTNTNTMGQMPELAKQIYIYVTQCCWYISKDRCQQWIRVDYFFPGKSTENLVFAIVNWWKMLVLCQWLTP